LYVIEKMVLKPRASSTALIDLW